MPKVFIVILNTNNWPDVAECLESLKKLDYPDYRVVVVDNGSAEKPQPPSSDIKIIYNGENLGFAGGNNVGIKYALENGADYVLVLNDDTIVSPDFLSKLVAAAESGENIGFAAPKIYFYSQPEKIWSAGGRINWLYTKAEMKGYGEIDRGQYDRPENREEEFLTACCLLAGRKTLEKIGLIPGEYFLYYEDTDWNLKARRVGLKNIFVPAAVIWHKGSKTTKAGSPSYIYYQIRNGLIFANRYAPWPVKPLVHLNAAGRAGKQIIKYIFLPEKRIWAKYILKGLKDFYLGKRGKFRE